MRLNRHRSLQTLGATLLFALAIAPASFGQTGDAASGSSTTTQARTGVAAGQKLKVKGIVTRRDADTFVVRDQSGAETTVRLTDTTSVKTKGGFLGGGSAQGQTAILRGLNLEVEGRGDSSGQLVAEKIRFSDRDLTTARTVVANVTPVENRVGQAEGRIGQAEQNSQRLSGQLDELSAVANTARGGAAAAQETADRAVEGVRVANDRIEALDDYTPQQSLDVNFRYRSAVLSPEAKQKLDELAQSAQNGHGLMFEVNGYAYDFRNKEANHRLSQQRADAVVRYLVETHHVPLRRIITPYGYGSSATPVADNTTGDGRAQNRRAEVRVLVNRGLSQPGAEMNQSKSAAATPQ